MRSGCWSSAVTDIALAAAALVLLFPFMLLIALLIRLTSPGPAIFRQERCGLNGRRFMFYKFRSMCDNAEELKASLAHLSQKSTAFKIRDDPRLTAVGRFLRKFSIDEWPQLWNVLKGDMSLVGPRPAVPEEVELYQRWQRRRLRMRPGLTCLWAVKGRDALDFETWMKMDMQYIDNWSLALDWKIILRTIPARVDWQGRLLARTTICTWFPPKKKWSRLLRHTGAIRDGHFEYPNGLHANRIHAGTTGHALLPARQGAQRGIEPPAAREPGDPRHHSRTVHRLAGYRRPAGGLRSLRSAARASGLLGGPQG